jgi:hypothetical protein
MKVAPYNLDRGRKTTGIRHPTQFTEEKQQASDTQRNSLKKNNRHQTPNSIH